MEIEEETHDWVWRLKHTIYMQIEIDFKPTVDK